MNLIQLIKYVILIWLPLATSEFPNRDKAQNGVQNEKNSKLPLDTNENKKEIILGSDKDDEDKKNSEGKLIQTVPNKWKKILTGGSRASRIFPIVKSAKSKLKDRHQSSIKGERDFENAHKTSNSVKKDLSAPVVIVSNEEKSGKVWKTRRKQVKGGRKALAKNSTEISKREAVMQISLEETDPLDEYEEEELEVKERNMSEIGGYLGAPCESTCSEKLLHVFCDPRNRICECEEKYPVQIGVGRGCEKPKQLGDQCFYAQTCSFFDPNAECTQINHNAICQCKPGFHSVALRKGVKRMFCSEDIEVVSADLPTLLGVATGIAVLTGLICFVLRLFSGNRYPPTRHYANTHIAPPLLLSSDNQWINGIPLTVHGRPSSRSSYQRSTTSLAQYPRTKGVMVPASRAGAARAAAILLIPCHLQASRTTSSAVVRNTKKEDTDVREKEVEQTSHIGSRRPSLSSVHSTTSSQRSSSYSARRFEQENQQREQRAAMRAAREGAARGATNPTPSPISTDELILSASNTEEDPLCLNTTTTPAQSEPPALTMKVNNIPPIPETTNSDTPE